MSEESEDEIMGAMDRLNCSFEDDCRNLENSIRSLKGSIGKPCRTSSPCSLNKTSKFEGSLSKKAKKLRTFTQKVDARLITRLASLKTKK